MKKKGTIQRQLLRIMRFSIIQLCILVLSATFVLAHDGNAQDILDRPLSVRFENESLKTVLQRIEKTAEVSFSYKKGILSKEKKVTLDAKNEKLSTILDRIFHNTNLEYEVMGQQIILTKAKSSSQISPPSVLEAKISENVVSNPVFIPVAIAITGKILSETKEPLVGATVAIKGTTTGTLTDENGQFALSVPDKEAVLLIQFIGYLSQEIKVSDQTNFTIVLEPNDKTLGEVVVIGYGTTNRRDILGSVSSVKDKEVEQTTPVNAFDAIQGRLAGVQITSNGGPGSGSDIKIRGTSTFSGGVNPLYIVDGQQLDDIDNLNPNDIASIEVLKDGASAAIYGSKSANGVVIITTKSGKAGDVKFNVDYSNVISNVMSTIPIATTKERVFYENVRAGLNPDIPPGDSLNILYQYSPDIQALLFRTASRNQINASLSGGTNAARFYWNTGVMDEQGVVVNSLYRRYTSRLKIDTDIKKKLTAGTTINFSYEYQKGLNENTVFQQLAERIPYFPIYEPNGNFTPEIAGRQNSVAEAVKTRRDIRNFRAQSFNFAQLQILPYLSFKTTLGVNFRLAKLNNFDPTIVQTVGNPPTGSEQQSLDHDFQHENYFTFKKKYGKHNVQAIAGMQLQRWNSEDSRLTATSFLSDNIETFNNVREFNLGQTNTGRSQHSLLAYFGDASYDYKGKYLIKGTLRRDGSSRFGTDKRYGVFPSGSIGWRVSSEKFMRKINDQVSNLMIRYSLGATGNERIGDYESRFLYRPGSFYNATNGVAPFQIANPFLGWESTISKNLGIDASLLRNRLSLTVDFWDKTTKDLLYDVPVPEETGYSSVRRNTGSVQNKGIDISLSGSPIKKGGFEWFSSFNITFLKNKVLNLANGTEFQTGNFIIREGESLGNFFGYINKGIFPYNESNAFTSTGEQLTPTFDDGGKFKSYNLNGSAYTGTVNQIKLGGRTLGGGDIWWADLNNDFLIDGAKDRTIIGNGLAKYFGGFFNEFKYKGLSLGILTDYNFGNQIFRNYDQQRNDLNSANETPSPVRIRGAWIKAGDVSEFATLDRNRTQNQLGPNSQYIDKGDYIKWRSVRLNYSLPESLYKSIKFVSNVTFNFSVNNIMTFTNYPGYNPELGSRGNPLQPGQDNLRYPNKRDFILGMKAQF